MNRKFILAALGVGLVFAFGCDGGGGGDKENNKGTTSVSSSSVDSSTGGSSSSLGGSSSSSELVIDGVVAVKIGTQTWMKKNLDDEVDGSKCYNNLPENCDKYGRLYDWATAMNLPSSCNESECASQIQTKHKGICPTGWHIPSDEDWDKLFRSVDGNTGTDSPYSSYSAGKDLKATSGWNSDGNGTDKHGFAALPGGFGGMDGSFSDVGKIGYWWNTSEYDAIRGYHRKIYNAYDGTFSAFFGKAVLTNVRCLKD